MIKSIKTNKGNFDTSILMAMSMITNKDSQRVVLSKYSAARFWGFSSLLTKKINVFIPKGYNNKRLRDYFEVNYKTNQRLLEDVEVVEFEGRKFIITSPERTFVELIKDFDGEYNDQKIEIIRNFFDECKFNRNKLLFLAEENKVKDAVLAFEAICGQR